MKFERDCHDADDEKTEVSRKNCTRVLIALQLKLSSNFRFKRQPVVHLLLCTASTQPVNMISTERARTTDKQQARRRQTGPARSQLEEMAKLQVSAWTTVKMHAMT